MRTLKKFSLLMVMVSVATGCSSAPKAAGHLGFADERRVVIVGEKVDPGIADYYQRTYDAMVWFTPSEGKFTDSANRFLELGPTKGMRMLIAELKSINYTVGRWEIIIPKIAEGYFLTALGHMEDGALSKARGMVILIDSSGNKNMESQIKRVTQDNFFITYK